MAVIRANRESIDDRFSVLGFTVRSELPLFEIAIATDPELLRPELRTKRNPGNFHTSRLLRAAPSQRGEAVYLVPPEVVSRFVGQQRLYFGLATYRESDRSTPVSMRMPDRGTMYVSLSGLTERGLRRSVRSRGPMSHGGAAYGGGGVELGWGGDAAGTPQPPSRDEDRATAPKASTVPGAGGATGYSDGYSDDLWAQPAPAAAAPVSTPPTAPSATAQGLAKRNGALRRPMVSARSLLISSDYQPANFWDALRAQAGFFLDSAMWYLGVADTRVMPHSAICQIRRPDGSAEGALHGSGFFIGPRLIMTAAHVVDNQSELIVVPGKNGGGTGSTTEPFGRFKVSSANFRKFTGYSGDGDFDRDMALICVPSANAVPTGRYFDLVEELNQSRPEGVVVSGYAARWKANTPIEQYVNDNIDPNRQHMMGGYIRELPTDRTFTYNLQTLAGTSGSPVYWIEDGVLGPQAHLVGVHVAAFDEHSNRGCRITGEKLAWIRNIAAGWGQTLTFAQSVRGVRSLSTVDEDSGYDIGGPIPDQSAPDNAATTAQGWYGARGLTLTASEYPMASRFEAAATGNYRAVTGTRTIDKIVIHITDGGANINGTISWFKNPAAKVSAHYVIGQDGEIVQMVAHNDVAWHAGSANGTSIGIEHVANTRGLNPTPVQMCASAALVTWLCDQFGITPSRANIQGHAEADGKTTHSGCPNAVWDWVYYMDMITTRTCYVPESITPSTGLALVYGRALEDDGADPEQEPDEDPEEFGIAGDIPDDALAGAQAVRALAAEMPDYPGASRFAPAHKNNYRKMKPGRTIDRIVIHITAGGPNIGGTIAWFQNGNRINPRTQKPNRSSAHYIVGRDGEVVQMVRNRDKAHHASQVNKRSIGIEHNANKPYGSNQRDLPPTEPQYAASAKLVAWLCAQYGIPVDRVHIVGHKEASPKDNHDCPSSYWQWDHYMDLVRAEAIALGIPAEVGRSIGSAVGGAVGGSTGAAVGRAVGGAVGGVVGTVGRAVGGMLSNDGYASALEVVQPYYDPSDPHAALSCTDDAMSREFEEWFVGVEDTRQFPHSAICLLNMTAPDGSTYSGTGFYIGRNRILTCAHNLHGMSGVEIIPGRNGSGSQPFGKTRVTSSGWRIYPGYGGDGDWPRDLAVIDNVPIKAPNGMWFEFLNATPSDRLPLAVCGYSGASNAIPGLTDIIDDQKQHLHGGKATRQEDPETIDYAILSLMGASGSPVYTVENEAGTLKAKICAVHVSGQPARKDHLNRGCFITPAKIDWIEGRATSLSLGLSSQRPVRALGNDGPSDLPVHLIPQPNKDACWAAAMAMLLAHRRQQSRTPESVVNDVGGSLASSYGWELIEAVKTRYGFEVISQPSNASIYHTPKQWAEWLNAFGPLWVVIVGAPHAVVVAGIRGNLDDAAATQVKILNPWDTRVAFDNDPIKFHPANNGYEDWLPFADFTADFGNMAEPDYGNWRILHLPANASGARAQALGDAQSGPVVVYLDNQKFELSLPPSVDTRAKPPVAATASSLQAVEIASVVIGATMERIVNNTGDISWELEQLRGFKHPNDAPPSPMPPARDGTAIRTTNLPKFTNHLGDEISAGFEINWQYNGKSVGNVQISNIRTNDAVGWGLSVNAKIMDDNVVYSWNDPNRPSHFAALRIRFGYHFTRTIGSDVIAIRDVHLFGDGTYTDTTRFEQG